ncbi:uncharacterized protein [Magallana gigas]|uniref:Uncharacterized protein n=1 Tax=Magallana gigas TaxID=29159 RepID=A0A8W8J185_MAGGI|nr:uncharacterized protein LOC105317352 [Crassostrea gigas]
MGLIQSCIGKRSNKVDVMSEEEAEAYSKMEEEIKKELVDDNIQTKPLPWMMFCTEPIVPKPFTDEVPGSPVLEVVQKKGGVAFDIGYKSTVPKLPPINAKRVQVPAGGEDYEKWKAERDKLLVDKHEKAKIRRERITQEKKLSAQRPRTARSRDAIESTPSKD